MPMDRRRLLALLAGLPAAAAPWTAAAAATAGEREALADRLIGAFVKPDGPGALVSIMEGGRIAFAKGYGLADIAQKVPISRMSNFDLASTSKQFTALAICQMAVAGALSLGDDVRRYLPELPDYGAPITLYHLIHHLGGTKEYGDLRGLSGQTESQFYDATDILVQAARQRSLNNAPGAAWNYNNTGYIFLAMVAERVSGKPFWKLVEDQIFKPLGMTTARVYQHVTTPSANLAVGYRPDEKAGWVVGPGQDTDVVGDGGVRLTIDDLAAFDADVFVGKVWTPQIKALMLTPGRLTDGRIIDRTFMAGFPYAGGLFVGKAFGGTDVVFHGGNFAGFRIEYLRAPSRRRSVAVFCNAGNVNPLPIAAEILGAELSADREAAAAFRIDRYWKRDPKGTPLDAARRARLVGRYHSPDLAVTWQVANAAAGLTFEILERGVRYTEEDLGGAFTLVAPGRLQNSALDLVLREAGGAVRGFDVSLERTVGVPFNRVA